MVKTLTLKQTGFWVEGTAEILLWGDDIANIEMDSFHVDSLEDIPNKVNDGQFGCQAILAAECNIFEDYEGTHRFLETRNYIRGEIGMNAPRGV